VDGVGTNKLAGGLRSDRELNPEFGDAIQQIIDKGYDDFISMVAAARKMPKEKVDEIAQGRVWAGADAYELGLVDKLGGFKDALDSAAKLAKLGDNYKIKYIRKKRSFREELISKLFSEVTPSSDTRTGSQLRQPLNPLGGLMQAVLQQGEILSRFNDPNGIYAYWTDGIE
jgi:protease-4